MKVTILAALAALALAGCGGASDGDAKTDTTNMQIDTGGLDAPNDTARHVNTATGEYPNDTMAQHNVKGDLRSSSPTSPSSRSATPGNDTALQKQ